MNAAGPTATNLAAAKPAADLAMDLAPDAALDAEIDAAISAGFGERAEIPAREQTERESPARTASTEEGPVVVEDNVGDVAPPKNVPIDVVSFM